jgi:hypothetical protein
MPEKLWTEVLELAARFGVNPIRQIMGLTYGTLKARLEKEHGHTRPAPKPQTELCLHPLPTSKPNQHPVPPAFVELGGSHLLGGIQAGPVLEVSTPDGVRVVIRLPVGSSVDLASLMTSFLGGRA